jgi:lipopolysaccharide/colanic/teichoic acid biosynthesis glycosyltransferase
MGLLCLSSLLLAIALILTLIDRQNPLFCQWRVGQHNRFFRIYKFRTMANARDVYGNLLPDSARITPLGHWLRRTSLDELPQLLNVFLGQMSLVGPRPLPVAYASALAHHPRTQLRPGLTGWAQIHGRNHLSWDQKFAHDAWYAANCSFRTDCLVLWRTLFVLLDTSPLANPLPLCFFTEPEGTPVSSSAS